MLFDLRGRGRRRAVQAIYLGLAILMGGGLVLFGVGGATNGGLLDAFKGSSGNQSVNDTFQKRVTAAEKGVRLRPTDAAAWGQLTKVRFQQAAVGDGFDQTNGVFTDKGKSQLRAAEASWNKYLSLTKKPDDTVAQVMIQAFGQAGLNEPDKAVNAMEIVIDASPDATGQQYVQLAALAYQAGQTRKAELASQKAIQLTPKDNLEQVKAALQSARTAASAAVSTATPSNTATPSG